MFVRDISGESPLIWRTARQKKFPDRKSHMIWHLEDKRSSFEVVLLIGCYSRSRGYRCLPGDAY